jgi:RNA polymerase sigma-70 factor (ECF subfamily)
VQPAPRQGRRIIRELRSEPPLVYARLGDAVLIKRAKDGDARALEALCTRHAPRVEKLARHILSNPEDAQDAAQESLTKLIRSIKQFRGESQFSTWLHRLVINTCLDAAERRKARVHEPLGEHLQSGDDPARDAGNSELRRELCIALADVSPEQAQVVLLKDALGYSFEEIASAAGMPVGTAKCHAHRGRARLSERLEDNAA